MGKTKLCVFGDEISRLVGFIDSKHMLRSFQEIANYTLAPYYKPTQVDMWISQRQWDNHVEGTRQINPVTSEKGGTLNLGVGTKLGVATVY
jgi:hypothetical protein